MKLTNCHETWGAEPIQAPRALAPSARSMEELEANRLHLRERRHPKKEETREETEAEEKDQGPFCFLFSTQSRSLTGIWFTVDETNEGEGLHTLRSETGSHGEMVRSYMPSAT